MNWVAAARVHKPRDVVGLSTSPPALPARPAETITAVADPAYGSYGK